MRLLFLKGLFKKIIVSMLTILICGTALSCSFFVSPSAPSKPDDCNCGSQTAQNHNCDCDEEDCDCVCEICNPAAPVIPPCDCGSQTAQNHSCDCDEGECDCECEICNPSAIVIPPCDCGSQTAQNHNCDCEEGECDCECEICNEPVPANALLKGAYADYFPIGAAMTYSNIMSGLYEDGLIDHFNSMTCENEMKWDALQPSKGNFNFTKSNAMISYAKNKDMKVRGHALVWHNQLPSWVTASNNKATVLQNITDHISRVVPEYGSDVYCWDVANEVLDTDDGSSTYTYRGESNSSDSALYNICGIDFIKTAFTAARAANPDIQLFYNDYNLNYPNKRDKAVKMIRKLKEDGVPIDGIGMQAHYDIDTFNIVNFENSIKAFIAEGLKVQITELDVSVYAWNNTGNKTTFTDVDSAKQAAIYRQIFEVLRKYKNDITGVTMWGVADDHTWLHNFPVNGRTDYPMLFDHSHNKKPAYYDVINFNGIVNDDPSNGGNPVEPANVAGSMQLDGSSAALIISGNTVTYKGGINNGQYTGVKWDLTGWNATKHKYVTITIQNNTNVTLTNFKYRVMTNLEQSGSEGFGWPDPADVAAGGSLVFKRDAMSYDMSQKGAAKINTVRFFFTGASVPSGSVTITISFSSSA